MKKVIVLALILIPVFAFAQKQNGSTKKVDAHPDIFRYTEDEYRNISVHSSDTLTIPEGTKYLKLGNHILRIDWSFELIDLQYENEEKQFNRMLDSLIRAPSPYYDTLNIKKAPGTRIPYIPRIQASIKLFSNDLKLTNSWSQ